MQKLSTKITRHNTWPLVVSKTSCDVCTSWTHILVVASPNAVSQSLASITAACLEFYQFRTIHIQQNKDKMNITYMPLYGHFSQYTRVSHCSQKGKTYWNNHGFIWARCPSCHDIWLINPMIVPKTATQPVMSKHYRLLIKLSCHCITSSHLLCLKQLLKISV